MASKPSNTTARTGVPAAINPRPRAILHSLDIRLLAAASGVFRHEIVVGASDPTYDADWDVMVQRGGEVGRSSGLFTLGFGLEGASDVYPLVGDLDGTPRRIDTWGESHSLDLLIPEGLPEEVADLVRNDLVPGFQSGKPRIQLVVRSSTETNYVGMLREPNPRDYLEPFLYLSDGSVLAGRARTAKGTPGWGPLRFGECWFLPDWVENPAAWIKAAWRHWSTIDPNRVPPPPDWGDGASWFTRDEADLHEQMLAVEREREQVLARLEASAQDLRVGMDHAREAAEQGPRRVLRCQGADLVDAVRQMLVDLGFEVEDMDEAAQPGDLLEDLRVRYLEFEALVEVRGYKRGAQLADLMRLGRMASRYQQEKGSPPSAQWYVVNEFYSRDPGERGEKPLAANPHEVAEFSNNPGLVLSTVSLYRLWQAVARGDITPDAARTRVLEGNGYFATG